MSHRPVDGVTLRRLSWVLRLTTAMLLLGRGGSYGAPLGLMILVRGRA